MYFVEQHTHAAEARKTQNGYSRRKLPRNVDFAQSQMVADCEHLEWTVNTLSGQESLWQRYRQNQTHKGYEYPGWKKHTRLVGTNQLKRPGSQVGVYCTDREESNNGG